MSQPQTPWGIECAHYVDDPLPHTPLLPCSYWGYGQVLTLLKQYAVTSSHEWVATSFSSSLSIPLVTHAGHSSPSWYSALGSWHCLIEEGGITVTEHEDSTRSDDVINYVAICHQRSSWAYYGSEFGNHNCMTCDHFEDVAISCSSAKSVGGFMLHHNNSII